MSAFLPGYVIKDGVRVSDPALGVVVTLDQLTVTTAMTINCPSTFNDDITMGAGDDINIGANEIVTTNLSLGEWINDATYWAFLNAAKNSYRNIVANALQLHNNILLSEDAIEIQGNNNDDDFVKFMARDNGVGLVEVARLQGAADPYFSMGGTQQFKFYNSGFADFGGYIIHSGGQYYNQFGTEPAQAADTVGISGFDLAAGRRTFALSSEENVAVEAALASTHTLAVRINGATYRIMLTNA